MGHVVGFNRRTRTVYLKSFDAESDSIHFYTEKEVDFKATRRNEIVQWKKSEDEEVQEIFR